MSGQRVGSGTRLALTRPVSGHEFDDLTWIFRVNPSGHPIRRVRFRALLEFFKSSLIPGSSFFKLACEPPSQFNHGLAWLSLKSLSQLMSRLSSCGALLQGRKPYVFNYPKQPSKKKEETKLISKSFVKIKFPNSCIKKNLPGPDASRPFKIEMHRCTPSSNSPWTWLLV